MPQKPKKNAAAVALGRRGKGKPKTLSAAALQQRRKAGFRKAAPLPDHYFQLPAGPLPPKDDDWDDVE